MASVNLQELNNFIHNMQNQVGVNEKEGPGSSVKQYLIDNLSNIGRYAHRDFERFGNYVSQEGDADHFDRQDGWVALTEEVPSIDHLTYGTGVLYIHGEMEIPPYEDDPGDNIFGDEFYHVDKSGGTKHIYDDVVNPERFIDWGSSSGNLVSSYAALISPSATNRGDAGPLAGYVWEWKEETHTGTIGDGRWLYETITDAVGGEFVEEFQAIDEPYTNEETPPIHYDDKIYNVDNERNHFPYVVINSTRPASIKSFLEDWEGKNGMYDEELPVLAQSSYPPKKHGGIKYVKGGITAILDFISPLEETP